MSTLETVVMSGERPTAADDSPRLLTVAEVASRLRVHRSTLVRWADAGIGPTPIRLGRPGLKSTTVRFDADDVERWLRARGLPSHR
jgi:excisionase family DNA binding protein